MKVIADLCIIPMGVGVSVSPQIALCERILADAGLKTKLHAYGTNIQGEWDTVFAAIKTLPRGAPQLRRAAHLDHYAVRNPHRQRPEYGRQGPQRGGEVEGLKCPQIRPPNSRGLRHESAGWIGTSFGGSPRIVYDNAE